VKRKPSARSAVKLAIIAVALLLALFPLPARFIERFYTNGIYPLLQALFTPVTNRIPFALVDVLLILLIIGLPAWWIVRLKKAGRGRRWRATARLGFQTLTLAALLYLLFLLLWGFNYERVPLAAKLDFDEQRLSTDGLKQLYRTIVERLNAESIEAHGGDWPDETEWRARLHEAFDKTVTQLGNRRGIAAAAPKKSLLNFYLAAAGIEGFVNPFGYEVVLDKEVLPFEKPFLLAHEWGHLAGFADESEASFVGLLACLQSDAAALRYSGWLALYMHTPWPRSPEGAKEEPPRLAPEIIADLRAINERETRRQNATVSRIQWAVYDRFLKASGVQAGVASYGMLVRLVLGTRFEDGWIPARR
jgi:hypothetical protein